MISTVSTKSIIGNGNQATASVTVTPRTNASSTIYCLITDTVNGATYTAQLPITWQPYYTPLTSSIQQVSTPTPTMVNSQVQTLSFTCTTTGGSNSKTYAWSSSTPTPTPVPTGVQTGIASIVFGSSTSETTTVTATLSIGLAAKTTLTCLVTDANGDTSTSTYTVTWSPYFIPLSSNLFVLSSPTPTLLGTQTQVTSLQCITTGGSSSYLYTWSVSPNITPTPTLLITGQVITGTTSSLSISPSTPLSTLSNATVTAILQSGSNASSKVTCLVTDQIYGLTYTITRNITWQNYFSTLTSFISQVNTPNPTLFGTQQQTLSFICQPIGGNENPYNYSYQWNVLPNTTPVALQGVASPVTFGSSTSATSTVTATLTTGSAAVSKISCTVTDTVTGLTSISPTYTITWNAYYLTLSSAITQTVAPSSNTYSQTSSYNCVPSGGSSVVTYLWTISNTGTASVVLTNATTSTATVALTSTSGQSATTTITCVITDTVTSLTYSNSKTLVWTIPVDCSVSAWTAFSTCSVACGGGTQTQTRTVVTPASNGGAACPVLTNTQPCNTQACPVDCVVSAWSAWSACSTSCGGGTQTQTRTVVTPASNGGAACPVLTNTQPCNTQACPVDCVVSAWSAWSACSTSCGGGTQTQTRTVITPAANGGTACPVLSQSQACNTQACTLPNGSACSVGSQCIGGYCNNGICYSGPPTNCSVVDYVTETRYCNCEGSIDYRYCNINPGSNGGNTNCTCPNGNGSAYAVDNGCVDECGNW